MKIHSEAITPAPPGLTITDTTLPSGMVNQAYSHTMAAVGGTPPYTWSAMGLPTSLSIDTDTGGITGTPIAGDEGDHAVSITVQDDASGEYTKGYTLTINPEASNVMGDWRFDEGGGTTATDSSGWDNHGTIYGASYVSGHSNTALSFDGSNDYVAIPDDPSLDVTGDLSIEFWMRCDGIGNSYQALVSKRPSSDYTAPYYLGLDNRAAVGRTMAISFGLGSGTSRAHIVANNAITVGE